MACITTAKSWKMHLEKNGMERMSLRVVYKVFCTQKTVISRNILCCPLFLQLFFQTQTTVVKVLYARLVIGILYKMAVLTGDLGKTLLNYRSLMSVGLQSLFFSNSQALV